MSYDRHYDQDVAVRRLGRPGPALVWALVMTAALGGAGFIVWRAPPGGGQETRLIAALDDGEVDRLGRDVRRLTAEREELTVRLARVERGIGELKLAQAAQGPETTGSIRRPEIAPQPIAPGHPPAFAISLGPESSLESARRRWNALTGRYPRSLSALAARTVRNGSGARAFELLAGPFATEADAARACSELAGDGVPCDTTGYAGEPLNRS